MTRRGYALVGMILCLVLGLFSGLPGARGATGTKYVSVRLGYALTLPAGWKVQQGDCASAAIVGSVDNLVRIRITAPALARPAGALHDALAHGIATEGAVQGAVTYGQRTLGKLPFQTAQGRVKATGGGVAEVRALATQHAGHLYLLVGVAHGPTRAAQLRQLAQVDAVFASLALTTPNLAHPCASATPTPTRTVVPPTRTATSSPTATETQQPTATPAPPTATPVPPTATPVPPTETPVPVETLAPGQPGVQIATYYTSTRAAFDAWAANNYAPPPQVSSFPAGTTSIAFYYEYSNAIKDTSQIHIIIYSPTGLTFFAGQYHPTEDVAGARMETVYYVAGGDFPNGSYRADLIVDNVVRGRAIFTVG